jgi:hypothetical protein
VVALNLGEGTASVAVTGNVLVGSRRERDGERVEGTLELGPGEAAIVDVA